MHTEHHSWFSNRLDREMGVNVYGHFGAPVLVFPTSGGDEHEYAQRGMVDAVAHLIEAGRIKLFCVNSNNQDSWYAQAHPRHRSYKQAMYDRYVIDEVVPFLRDHCRTPDIAITTTGCSFGAYHAVNSLLKHPDVFRRCIALSGVYDLRCFMDGEYDDNFYFNNPVDYMANLRDPWYLEQLRGCEIHLVTGHGPWEDSTTSRQLAAAIRGCGLTVHLDDWGSDGGHDWPFWRKQIGVYLGKI